MQDSKPVFQAMFKDDSLTVGGQVKAKGEVLKEFFKARSKPPNTNCRVESFARICETFDSRRRRWVAEMGFGGLLYLSGDMHLPRQLGYWLMTRIDPISKMLITPDGRCLRLSRNQVNWVLGIPNGPKVLPSCKNLKRVQLEKVNKIIAKYGSTRKSHSENGQSRVVDIVGIRVYPELLERLESNWEENQEEEFKTLFLLIALEMLLCPTLSPSLAPDLVPALACAMDAAQYDWCTLVLSKLLSSVLSFARRFYPCGNAGGCGGCILFVMIFYLDRLDREAVQWGVFPRLKVWTMKEITVASKEDRSPNGGDFGCVGTLDVAYGEVHPRQARDTDGPGLVTKFEIEDDIDCVAAPKRRRVASTSKCPPEGVQNSDDIDTGSAAAVVYEGLNQTHGKIAVRCGCIPFLGNVDKWRRLLSDGALTLLRNMISVVMRSAKWFMIGDWPLLLSRAFLDVVAFDGAADYNTVLLPSLSAFILNPRCPVLVVVSEVLLPDSSPSMHRICIALKTNARSQMMLLSADSITSDISVLNRPMLNLDQVYHDIFVTCMKGLTACKLSRNMLLVNITRV